MMPGLFPLPDHRRELKVFNSLKDCPLAKDWIVLHSLDLANHTSQISGEADFVIIIPALALLYWK